MTTPIKKAEWHGWRLHVDEKMLTHPDVRRSVELNTCSTPPDLAGHVLAVAETSLTAAGGLCVALNDILNPRFSMLAGDQPRSLHRHQVDFLVRAFVQRHRDELTDPVNVVMIHREPQQKQE